MPTATIHRTQLRGLEKIYEGKVRDLYAVDAQYVADGHDGSAVRVRRGTAGSDPDKGRY